MVIYILIGIIIICALIYKRRIDKYGRMDSDRSYKNICRQIINTFIDDFKDDKITSICLYGMIILLWPIYIIFLIFKTND